MIRPLLLATASLFLATAAQAETVTLLSMNMWGAGGNAQKPIDETMAVMKAVNADIIAVQETVPEPDPCTADECKATDASRAKDIAAALGYNYHEFAHNTVAHWADAVISKYPFGKETPNGNGVEINVNGKIVVAYSHNLPDAPYGPYQLLNIEYGKWPFVSTAEDAVKYAGIARGKAIASIVEDIRAEKDAAAQFVMGDFNEPSHLDWSDKAVAAKLQPLVVPWPSTKAIEDEGFVDTFRSAFPDVVAKPGMTWTPTTEPTDPQDHHDRIDFILAKAPGVKIEKAGIVGEKAPEADIVVTPWPSDHRATMAVVTF